jgi:uncharacterized coiled-coil protein SlyX
MATIKKIAVKAPNAAPPKKAAAQKATAKGKVLEARIVGKKSSEELVAETITALSKVVTSLEVTLEMLVQKIESMANHIIAAEEVVAEVVASSGLNLARVNARIRIRIAAGTDNYGNANKAIDVAALIASPLPRQ